MKLRKIITYPLAFLFFPLRSSTKSFVNARKNSREVISGLINPENESSTHDLHEPMPQSFDEAVNRAAENSKASGEIYTIDSVYRSLLLKKRILLSGMYFMWVFASICFSQGRYLDALIMTVGPFSAVFFLYILQFRMWQISTRRLTEEECGALHNFKNEENWILKLFNPQLKNSFFHIGLLLVLLLGILLPQLAHASSLDELQNAASSGTDISKRGLVTIFGEVVNSPLDIITGDSDTFISKIFKVFGATLLMVATAVTGYMSLKTVGASAHDGQFLNNQQHSLWMPIRVLSGFSMLVPMGNGWSLSQLLMLYGATVVGIGGANLGQNAVLDGFANGQSFVMQPVAPSTSALAHQLFDANLCMYGINASLDKIQSQGGLVFPKDYVNQWGDSTSGFTLRSGSYTCGGATLNLNIADGVSSAQAGIDTTSLANAHHKGLEAMQTALMESAKSFVAAVGKRHSDPNFPLPNAESAISAASQAYENRVTSALQSFNANSQLKKLSAQIAQQMKTEGWWSLGSWYQTLATANARISNISGAKAKSFGADSSQTPDTYDLYVDALKAYSTQQTTTQKSNANVLSAGSNFVSIQPYDDPMSYVLSTSMQNVSVGFLRLLSVQNGQVNPLIALKNFGDYLSTAAEVGLTTYVAAKALAAGADNSAVGTVGNFFTGAPAAVKAMLDSVSPFILIALGMLFSASFVLVIYLPLLPFILWFSACLNWVTIVAEAIFAAPLWAFTHLHSEGEGMGPKTAHGYIFLLNVMIRPILMVGGFFMGGGIVVVGGTFLMSQLPAAIANAEYNSTVGVIHMLGLIVIFVTLCLTLVNMAFSLINVIPDQVINWVGGQASSHLGRDMESNAKGSTNVIGAKGEHLTNQKEKGKKDGSKGNPSKSGNSFPRLPPPSSMTGKR